MPAMKQPASRAKTVGALSRGHLGFHGHQSALTRTSKARSNALRAHQAHNKRRLQETKMGTGTASWRASLRFRWRSLSTADSDRELGSII